MISKMSNSDDKQQNKRAVVTLCASHCVSLDDLAHPSFDFQREIEGKVVAVISNDRPAFYIVSPTFLSLIKTEENDKGSYASSVEGMRLAARAEQTCAPPNSPTFGELADRLISLETLRYKRGELSKAAVGILRNRLDAHVLPSWGKLPVAHITTDLIDEFLERLTEYDLSPTTISQYFVIIRKLLKLAVRSGYLHAVPELPKVRIANRPRAALKLNEYRSLVKIAHRLCAGRVEAAPVKERGGSRERFWVYPRNLLLAPDMAWVVRFMVNSFVRPSDIRNLRHRHVEIVRGEHSYLRLNLPESKRHDLPIVTLTPAVRVYEAVVRRAKEKGWAEPDDYLFLPEEKNRAYVLAILGFWLKWLMREAGVPAVDHLGRPRTLYSLRHTAIMFRLLYGEGIDMLTLARNARTSVQMIERFYASSLTGEMNVGLLQSRRKGGARRDY